jgi:hypothetical protein
MSGHGAHHDGPIAAHPSLEMMASAPPAGRQRSAAAVWQVLIAPCPGYTPVRIAET